jgi:hypothetical protein
MVVVDFIEKIESGGINLKGLNFKYFKRFQFIK